MTAASYRGVLERFHGFYGPLEDGLLALGGWEAVGLDLGDRRKTPLLEADLRFLGVDDPRRLPICPVRPAPTTTPPASAASMSSRARPWAARLISRHIRTTMGLTPDAGGRFFHGYGDRTGPMWRSSARRWAASPSRPGSGTASSPRPSRRSAHYISGAREHTIHARCRTAERGASAVGGRSV